MAVRDAPTSARGNLGGGGTFGPGFDTWYTEAVEHVPELRWPNSVRTYGRMRHDSTIASTLAAYNLPIIRADWRIDPRGASGKLVKICADSLGLRVLGADPKPGPARQRGFHWKDHLRTALGHQVFGHMGFVPFYEIRNGAAYLAGAPERMPWTLTEIRTNDDGELLGVVQDSVTPGPGTFLPREVSGVMRLLWYVREKEGSNWVGRSALRSSYGPWLFKQEAMRGIATAQRRFGTGVPTMEALPGTSPTIRQMSEAQALATSYRGGEASGMVTPPGFRFRMAGVEGTMPDGLPWIRYLDEQMARSALASMLDLGSSANGSRALGQSFADLLAMAQQGVAEMIAETATALCVELTNFNDGDEKASPAVVVGDVGASRQTMAQSIAGLVQQGALTLDAPLEKWVREAFDLPDRSGPAASAPSALDPEAAAVADDANTAPAAHPATAGKRALADVPAGELVAAAADHAAREHRALTADEVAAGLSPAAIDAAATAATTAAMRSWSRVQAGWTVAVEDVVREAATTGDLTAITAATIDTSTATAVIATAATAGVTAGVDSATSEAVAQGVQPPPPDEDALAQVVTVIAATTVAVMLAGFLSSALRTASRWFGRQVTPDDLAAKVGEDLSNLPGGYVSDQLGHAVHTGIGAGRAEVFVTIAEDLNGDGDDGDGGTVVPADMASFRTRWFHSAVLDKNTCAACKANDGHEYADLPSAEGDFPTGGYALCLGRERCRCIIFMRWMPSTVAASFNPGLHPRVAGGRRGGQFTERGGGASSRGPQQFSRPPTVDPDYRPPAVAGRRRTTVTPAPAPVARAAPSRRPAPAAPAPAPAPVARRPAPAPVVRTPAPAPAVEALATPPDQTPVDALRRLREDRLGLARELFEMNDLPEGHRTIVIGMTWDRESEKKRTVAGKIVDRDGRKVGHFRTTFRPEKVDRLDPPSFYHDLLKVDPGSPKGIGTQFVGTAMWRAKQAGFTGVALTAHGDGGINWSGGYVWARSGADFANASAGRSVQGYTHFGRSDAFARRDVPAIRRIIAQSLPYAERFIRDDPELLAQWLDLVDRTSRSNELTEMSPTPHEWSQLGKSQAVDGIWLGKLLMLHSSWSGVKEF